jgi:hypothetical protein
VAEKKKHDWMNHCLARHELIHRLDPWEGLLSHLNFFGRQISSSPNIPWKISAAISYQQKTCSHIVRSHKKNKHKHSKG